MVYKWNISTSHWHPNFQFFLPLRKCRNQNKWKSKDEYSGWTSTSHSNSLIFVALDPIVDNKGFYSLTVYPDFSTSKWTIPQITQKSFWDANSTSEYFMMIHFETRQCLLRFGLSYRPMIKRSKNRSVRGYWSNTLHVKYRLVSFCFFVTKKIIWSFKMLSKMFYFIYYIDWKPSDLIEF